MQGVMKVAKRVDFCVFAQRYSGATVAGGGQNTVGLSVLALLTGGAGLKLRRPAPYGGVVRNFNMPATRGAMLAGADWSLLPLAPTAP